MAAAISQLRISAATGVIAAGGVVACPTEAVWGLSCDPDSEPAVRRLLQLKRRPVSKGLILVAASESQFGFLLQGLPRGQREQLSESWPGPNTWLVPHHGRVQPWIHGDHDTVAVRVSAHPTVKKLCKLAGPLVSTSANPSGLKPAKSLLRTRCYFHGSIDYFVPGGVGDAEKPTEIRDALTDRLIRP